MKPILISKVENIYVTHPNLLLSLYLRLQQLLIYFMTLWIVFFIFLNFIRGLILYEYANAEFFIQHVFWDLSQMVSCQCFIFFIISKVYYTDNIVL
jgi:hypothetical protein